MFRINYALGFQENFIEACRVTLRLFEMILQRAFQLRLGGGFNHLGQRFADLSFGGVELVKLIKVQLLKIVGLQ
jgi:hypothetical protein